MNWTLLPLQRLSQTVCTGSAADKKEDLACDVSHSGGDNQVDVLGPTWGSC